MKIKLSRKHRVFHEIDVPWERMPEEMRQHVVMFGLKTMLNNAHREEDDEAAAIALAEKKLAALMAGTVRVRAAGPASPLDRAAEELAEDEIKRRAKARGYKIKDIQPHMESLIASLLASDDGVAILVEAQRRIDAAASMDEGEGLADLLAAAMQPADEK